LSKPHLRGLLKPARLAVVFAALLAGGAIMAETTYTLQGRIMDTSDNWLPQVRVGLQRAGEATNTDGNGLFTLRFTAQQPLAADAGGIVEFLELDKDGYQGRTIEIKDPAYFSQPVAEKNFSSFMSFRPAYSIRRIHRIGIFVDSMRPRQAFC